MIQITDDPSAERTAPPRSTHVRSSNVSSFLIQQDVELVDEFRQHDGVVTILMFYRHRASPKHRYNIIEDYGGRGHRTRLRDLKD